MKTEEAENLYMSGLEADVNGEHQKAKEYFRQVTDYVVCSPDNKAPEIAWFYLMAGRVLIAYAEHERSKELFAQAEELFAKALRAYPNDMPLRQTYELMQSRRSQVEYATKFSC